MRIFDFLSIILLIVVKNVDGREALSFRSASGRSGSRTSGAFVTRRSTRQASSCFYRGQLYRCGLSITCLFTGGILTAACGSGLSCCRPQQSAVRPSRRRRGRGFRFNDQPRHQSYQYQHLPHFPRYIYQNNHRQQLYQQTEDPVSVIDGEAPSFHVVFRRRPHEGRVFGASRPTQPTSQNFIPPAATTISSRFQTFDEDHSISDNEIAEDSQAEGEPNCGRPYQFLRKRIIGGQEAGYGELPWQAHIRILGYQCGGVVVKPSFIVTAAHCVHKAKMDDIKVHLGEYDTKNTGIYPEPYPSEVRSVVEVRIHPHFHYMLTQPDRFDVAVLRLNYPVHYRPNILPICLPRDTDDFTGQTAVVAGWGKTDNSFSKTGTNVLNKAPVPIITNGKCLRWHHHKNIELQLHSEMFCAGHENGAQDACLGDSGGPLIVFTRNRWTLAGITSAGFGCAIDRQPGIYHKVSTSTRWIQHNIH